MRQSKLKHPIFIVGAPRSGTSLLRNLLNRHPEIAVCDETYFFYYVYQRRRAFGDLAILRNRRRLIESYLATRRIRRLGLDLDTLAGRLLVEGTNYPDFFRCLLQVFAESRDKLVIGEKTPQHAWFSRLLCRWFPDSTLIHLVRDPRDVVSSLLRMPWASESVMENTALWRSCVESAEHCKDHPGFIRVRYRDLVEDPDHELTSVCRQIGVDFTTRMLAVSPAPEQSCEPWFLRAQQGVTSSRIDKWREELEPVQAALVEWRAGPWLKTFGYSAESSLPGRFHQVQAIAQEIPAAFKRRFRLAPHLWYYWFQKTRLAQEEAWLERGLGK